MIREVSGPEIIEAMTKGFEAHQAGSDFLLKRDLGDGREVCLLLMGFGNLRLTLGPAGEPWWDRGFCYHDSFDAWRCALGWDGEGDPEGWYRDLVTHRRRPNGDPAQEYIAP